MTESQATETRSRLKRFAIGLAKGATLPLLLLVLAFMIGSALGKDAFPIVMFALMFAFYAAILLGFLIVVAVLLATFAWVYRDRYQLIGAIAFYAIAATLIFGVRVYLHQQEAVAMEEDYSSRAVENPVGSIKRLAMIIWGSNCQGICVETLVNGQAEEVVALTPPTKQEISELGYDKDQLLIRNSFRLARDRQCPVHRDLQGDGFFFECVVPTGTNGADLNDMIIIFDDWRAQRLYGLNATVAVQHTSAGKSEVLRWEWGTYPYSGKKVGEIFRTAEFLAGLTGIKTDRYSPLLAITFDAAIERIHTGFMKYPDLIDTDAFVYLKKVHVHELGVLSRRDTLLSTSRSRLSEIAKQVCLINMKTDRENCGQRYVKTLMDIFSPGIAMELEAEFRGN